MKCGQKKLENKEFSGKTDCRRHPNAPQSMKNQVKSTESTILLSACCYPLLLLYTAIVFIHLFIYCRRVFKFHYHPPSVHAHHEDRRFHQIHFCTVHRLCDVTFCSERSVDKRRIITITGIITNK